MALVGCVMKMRPWEAQHTWQGQDRGPVGMGIRVVVVDRELHAGYALRYAVRHVTVAEQPGASAADVSSLLFASNGRHTDRLQAPGCKVDRASRQHCHGLVLCHLHIQLPPTRLAPSPVSPHWHHGHFPFPP